MRARRLHATWLTRCRRRRWWRPRSPCDSPESTATAASSTPSWTVYHGDAIGTGVSTVSRSVRHRSKGVDIASAGWRDLRRATRLFE